MTERQRIIKIIEKWAERTVTTKVWGAGVYDSYNATELADALIEAGIGDVTKWKEKVECAKRILQIPTLPNGTTDLSYFEYKGERIQDIVRQRDEYKHRAEVAEKDLQRHKRALKDMCEEYEDDIECELYKECDSNKPCYLCDYTVRLQQAEREIEEEGKK